MRNFMLIRSGIDISPFRDELLRNEAAWQFDTSRRDKLACQRETEAIILRKYDRSRGGNPMDTHESCIARAFPYFPVATTWLEATAHSLDGELGRALFAMLRPHGQVYRHIDRGEYYAVRRRYHLVIASAGGSVMKCGEEEKVMHEGELWEFDNKLPHEAFNHSDHARIHLIFDLYHGDSPKSRVIGAQASHA
jgi:hypothetical protein